MKRWGLGIFCLFLPLYGYAQTGYPVLDNFFSDVRGFQADFTQIVYDENFVEIQNSTGQMALLRPNRFHWLYQQPYEQVIVGDGNEIWIYDIDLDQVTVKPQGETLGETPAQLLSSAKPVIDEFSVLKLDGRMGLSWFELKPLADETSFEVIRLGFRDQTMVKMELRDSLGNQTVFDFSNVSVNPAFDDKQFIFVAPEGVDVIGRE